jgi:hypothetical protein
MCAGCELTGSDKACAETEGPPQHKITQDNINGKIRIVDLPFQHSQNMAACFPGQVKMRAVARQSNNNKFA